MPTVSGPKSLTRNFQRHSGMSSSHATSSISSICVVSSAAALETTQIEEIEEVAWEELMPECLWKFRVKDFGPLTVGIDAHGNSLYHDVQAAAQKKLEDIFARL